MNEYLEEAAKLLRKAAEANEIDNHNLPRLANEGRERIAMQFAQLGAIEQGLIPAEMVSDLIALATRPHRPISDGNSQVAHRPPRGREQ